MDPANPHNLSSWSRYAWLSLLWGEELYQSRTNVTITDLMQHRFYWYDVQPLHSERNMSMTRTRRLLLVLALISLMVLTVGVVSAKHRPTGQSSSGHGKP